MPPFSSTHKGCTQPENPHVYILWVVHYTIYHVLPRGPTGIRPVFSYAYVGGGIWCKPECYTEKILKYDCKKTKELNFQKSNAKSPDMQMVNDKSVRYIL